MTVLAIIGTIFMALNVGFAISDKEYHSATGWAVATLLFLIVDLARVA